MENNIKVSVIIPIFNCEKYLEECIKSVLNQNYKKYEIILIDDGSTDNSKEIAEDYEFKYENIKLINQENKGVSIARNVGINNSHGEYIFFLDSDDIIKYNLLETCIKKMEEYDLDIIFFGNKIKSEIKSINEYSHINMCVKENVILNGKEFLIQSSMDLNFPICNQFYSRNFLNKNNIYFQEKIIYEDFDFTIKALIKADKVMNIQKALHIYRKRENSITTSKSSIQKIDSLDKIICNLFDIPIKSEEYNMNLKKAIKKCINHCLTLLIKNYLELDYKNEFNMFDYIEKYISKYMYIFNKVIEDEDICRFYVEINKLFINEEKAINELNVNLLNIYNKGLNKLNELRNQCLVNIPFNNKKAKIGMYGVGKHTENLLEFYEKNINHICCNLLLIDSFIDDNRKIYGRTVINVNKVNDYLLDGIVISSAAQEELLFSNLKKVLKNNIPIYRFYENNRITLFS